LFGIDLSPVLEVLTDSNAYRGFIRRTRVQFCRQTFKMRLL